MASRRSLPGIGVSALLGLAACGGGGSGGGARTDQGVALDLAAWPDLAPLADLALPPDLLDAYPPGPYGKAEGEVVPNFSFRGYLDDQGLWPATRLPYRMVSFQDLRQAGAVDGRRYLLLATGAFW